MRTQILRRLMIAMLMLFFGVGGIISSTKPSYADVKIEKPMVVSPLISQTQFRKLTQFL
jgi:hypothetical protein